MIYAFIRWWATIFLRLYFRKTIVYGLENVPATGPLIVASNHPSAFLEAGIVATVMKRPIHFLVRGDMFHPRFRLLFDWTKQIPIYRQKDGISNLRKNASSFDLTYRKLSEGEAVVIFPEAKTTLEKKMRPIQRGTAHLAFGTLPYLKDGQELIVQPVGVNYTEPRFPGTDVVVRFGEPFVVGEGTRDDRDAIDDFTQKLSDALSPLVIQVEDNCLYAYDVMAAIYYRMIHDNNAQAHAHDNLCLIASHCISDHENKPPVSHANAIYKELKREKIIETLYYPDLIVLNKVGLAIMCLLKLTWLIGGGWIWRLVKTCIFKKIKTNTFQAPTSIGVFMVVMPFMTLIFLVLLWILGLSGYWIVVWLLFMFLGTLIRPSLHVVWHLLMMKSKHKRKLSMEIIAIRRALEQMINIPER